MKGHFIIRLPIFLISCSFSSFDEMIPKLKDKINKDIEDVKRWKITELYNFKLIKISKIPNWADAIYIINLFKLYDRMSKNEKMKVNMQPNSNKTFK